MSCKVRISMAFALLFTSGCGMDVADEDINENYSDEIATSVTSAQLSIGTCCSDGDCLCRGEEPTDTSNMSGPYQTASYVLPFTGAYGGATVYYPTNAQPPFAGAVFCPPFTGTRIMYAAWGPFFASWGIVLATMDSLTVMDPVQSRAIQLAAAVDDLREENSRRTSPLFGKLADRFGVMGWSMGGGATWIEAAADPTLKSAISYAGHNLTSGGPINSVGTAVPSMMLAGSLDVSFLGGMGQSQGTYDIIPNTTPKILYVVNGVGHMTWGGPTSIGFIAGGYALAFEKTYLEGDTRWKKFLSDWPIDATEWRSNL